jgi:hypothetical protein
MRNRVGHYLENVGEAGCACLITMAHGNMLALTLSHWLIASQTGLVAGVLATTTVIAAKFRRQWLISGTLGIVTSAVDFYVHPATFGGVAVAEALVTGAGSTLLSVVAAFAVRAFGRRPLETSVMVE